MFAFTFSNRNLLFWNEILDSIQILKLELTYAHTHTHRHTQLNGHWLTCTFIVSLVLCTGIRQNLRKKKRKEKWSNKINYYFILISEKMFISFSKLISVCFCCFFFKLLDWLWCFFMFSVLTLVYIYLLFVLALTLPVSLWKQRFLY